MGGTMTIVVYETNGEIISREMGWCREGIVNSIHSMGIDPDSTLHIHNLHSGDPRKDVNPIDNEGIVEFCTKFFALFVNTVQAAINGDGYDLSKFENPSLYPNTPRMVLEMLASSEYGNTQGSVTNILDHWRNKPLLSVVMFITRFASEYQCDLNNGTTVVPEQVTGMSWSCDYNNSRGADDLICQLNKYGRVLIHSENGSRGLWFVLMLADMVRNGLLTSTEFTGLLNSRPDWCNGVDSWMREMCSSTHRLAKKVKELAGDNSIYTRLYDGNISQLFKPRQFLY